MVRLASKDHLARNMQVFAHIILARHARSWIESCTYLTKPIKANSYLLLAG